MTQVYLPPQTITITVSLSVSFYGIQLYVNKHNRSSASNTHKRNVSGLDPGCYNTLNQSIHMKHLDRCINML